MSGGFIHLLRYILYATMDMCHLYKHSSVISFRLFFSRTSFCSLGSVPYCSFNGVFMTYEIEDFGDLWLMQGDTLQRWRTEPFIMITGSGRYCRFHVSLNSK